MKPKLAIFGDSFGVTDGNAQSWIRRLEQNFFIQNYCICGIGEYKIWKQIEQVEIDQFDVVLVTHTSPTRVHVEYNPLHSTSQYHQQCDIIYADIAEHNNEFARACKQFFKHIYNETYQIDMFNLVIEKIENMLKVHPHVQHITHFDYTGLHQPNGLVNFYDVFCEHRGNINHYTPTGNDIVYNRLLQCLK